MDLINALPSNSSVNMNRDNYRREAIFYEVHAGRAHGAVEVYRQATEL
jgi:hypothetical protein